jgi:peptidoglycan hydrolase-like protein with peptidoglycan-binding domain
LEFTVPISAARSVILGRVSTPSSSPELASGDFGASVTELQNLLKRAGVPVGPVDGDFGPMTTAAVKRFQTSRGLPVDGVVGARTWAALRANAPAPTPSGATPELRSGDLGADVEKLQQALEKHGFEVGGVDGSFGPGTRLAVVRFQRAKGLDADGVVGPNTWRALAGPVVAPAPRPSGGDLRSRLLDAARGEIGTTESGNNRGEALKYPNHFGRGAEAWCADFVSYVTKQAGGSMNDPYCPSVVDQLKADGNWKGKSNPQPGDLVLFDWDGDREADHIGIVERVNSDGTIGTIEGNTENPQTGQEGVWRRTRTMGVVLGFGQPY